MTKRKSAKSRKRRPQTLLRRIKANLRRHWTRYRWWLLAIVVAIVAARPVGTRIARFLRPVKRTVAVTAKDYNGIDVSKYQGNINWKKVADDPKIQFVYLKATEGATKSDKRYDEYLRKARAEGIKVGSYHFFVSFRTGEQQFQNFKRHVPRGKQDLIPMVDVEEAGNRTANRARLQKELSRFMELVKEEYGHYPLLYSQYSFYNKMLAPEFNRYFLFIARYGPKPPVLKGGGAWNLWQFSDQGRIDGIKGRVDLDRFAPGTSLSDIEM